MTDEHFKQRFAFILLFTTVLWALLSLVVTYIALRTKTDVTILAAAGVDGLLGALITWNALVIQFFFRKAKPEAKT